MAGGYGIDPYVWMDAGLWVRTVPTIEAKLAEMAPSCAPRIEANARAPMKIRSKRTIQAVIDAVGQRGQDIAIGGELYSDAMGEPGTPGGTYIGMIYRNTRRIVLALGGEPAPLPDQLRPSFDASEPTAHRARVPWTDGPKTAQVARKQCARS